MSDNLSSNPFIALFGSEAKAQEYRSTASVPSSESAQPNFSDTANIIEINSIIENVFLVTVDKEIHRDRPAHCILLPDLRDSLGEQSWLDEESLEQAVMERIMMEQPSGHVIKTSPVQRGHLHDDEVDEKDVIRYLASSFCRLKSNRIVSNYSSLYNTCQRIILQCSNLAFQNSTIFTNCDPGKQFVDLLLDSSSVWGSELFAEYFDAVAAKISSDSENSSVLESFRPVLDRIHKKLTESSLGDPAVPVYIDLVSFFTRKPCLALALLEYSSVADPNVDRGKAYGTTLFGVMLSFSCLPKSDDPPFPYFNHSSQISLTQVESEENIIFSNLEILNEKIYSLMLSLLKLGGTVREKLLIWFGKCLHANRGRAKLSAQSMLPAVFKLLFASDGFFLNLCSVFLRLSAPFSECMSPKLLKLQPTYCMAIKKDAANLLKRNIHMIGLDESTLVPVDESDGELISMFEQTYSFSTECFFMTHYCLKIGFQVLQEGLLKMNQNLAQIQRLAHSSAGTPEAIQSLKEELERLTSIYLCHKAFLTQPSLLNLAFNFHAATATYLTHIATVPDDCSQFLPVKFPLRTSASARLACLPEFLTENVQEFLLFVHRFKDSLLEEKNDMLKHFLTFVLVFMGSPQFMRNPHLRAGMAEALGALLPNQTAQVSTFQPSNFYRDRLFEMHEHIQHLSNSVISVFVSIEVTGQAHFEDKFRYRQPMYQALEYMWGIEIHREALKRMAANAEEHIDDVEAPLFLRFINLLINDAIYLLDEALSYMSQIKEKQEARDSGAWNSLAPQQRQEAENGYRHMSMLARFHNIMGRKTIESLEMVTQHIKTIFVNSVMVDRVAAMLNYFLLHLVGPKMKTLKVKNFEEFQFVPKILVSNICKIYINLGDYDNFCLAVSQDGRSYSHDLFEKAENVLCKIHDPLERISRLNEVGGKIKAMANRQAEDDELLSDIPEDYTDPIMGTLMRDPVLLPTSGKIVDRQTIARHLLSDQTDPFNRMPLTMNVVKPAVELKQEIEAWIADIRQKHPKSKREPSNSESQN